MREKILFSLENCPKCMQTKEIIKDLDDIDIVTFPHNIKEWSNDELNIAESYGVFDLLQKTAPILWINGEKIIGYLRIRKWVIDKKIN